MKAIPIFLLTLMIFATSCHPSYQSRNAANDDVYYSSKTDPSVYSDPNSGDSKPSDNNNTTSPDQYNSANGQKDNQTNNNDQSNESRFDYANGDTQNQENTSSSSTTEKDGNTYITNNYYNDDDYYDYAYTARIRRFHRPCGWSYYDNYYTNSYWYDYNPYSYGVSIYLGYNFWAPSYYYNYNPFYSYYGGFYSPYYAYNAGYYNGYNNGYWNGYYNGLYNNPYYYNSYDNNTHYYYGPRTSGGRNTRNAGKSLGQLYEANIRNDKSIGKPNQGSLNNANPAIRNNNIKTETGPIRNNGSNTGGVKPSRESNVPNTGGIKPIKESHPGNANNIPVEAPVDKYTPGNTGGTKPIKENNSIRNDKNLNNDRQIDRTQPNQMPDINNDRSPKNDKQYEIRQPNQVPSGRNLNTPREEKTRTRQEPPTKPEPPVRNENRNNFHQSSPSNSGGSRQQTAPSNIERKQSRPR